MDESADRFQNAIDNAIEAQIREAFALKDEDELGEALNAIYVAATDGALRALLSLGCPLDDVEGAALKALDEQGRDGEQLGDHVETGAGGVGRQHSFVVLFSGARRSF